MKKLSGLLVYVLFIFSLVTLSTSNSYIVTGPLGNPGSINQNIQGSHIQSEPVLNAGIFREGGNEVQPVFWRYIYGPIVIPLPARTNLKNIQYFDNHTHQEYDEGIIVGYVEVGVNLNSNIDLASKVKENIQMKVGSASNPDIAEEINQNGFPIAYSKSEYSGNISSGFNYFCVGACRCGGDIFTITLFNKDVSRLHQILDGIKEAKGDCFKIYDSRGYFLCT
ncbi:MAG: hypothetical protein ACE14P_04660 [Methanotrichaceae archaeon]